ISNVVRLRDEIITYSKENIYDGFVITHGTDTLEETAFLIDLLIDIQEPIVITGAMRSSNEIGSDGLYNFISAIRVASSSEANHKG
ncbi:asparaginase domain-containing protein, partial [Staphylococcus warneri]